MTRAITAGLGLAVAGALLMTLGVALGAQLTVAAGAMLAVARGIAAQREDDPTRRRRLAIGVLAAFAIIAAGALQITGRNYWPLPLLCAAAVEIYTSLRD